MCWHLPLVPLMLWHAISTTLRWRTNLQHWMRTTPKKNKRFHSTSNDVEKACTFIFLLAPSLHHFTSTKEGQDLSVFS